MARYPPLHLGFWIVGCAVGLASCLNVAQAEEGPSDVAIFQLAMRVVDAGAQVDGLSEALSVATDTANSESDREMARQLAACVVWGYMIQNSDGAYNAWAIKQIPALPAPKQPRTACGFAYGFLLASGADDAANRSDWKSAQEQLLRSRPFLESGYAVPGMSELQSKVPEMLAGLDTRISGRGATVDSYVTNVGLTQSWIGRVVAVEAGGVLRVRITYAASPSATMKVGAQVTLPATEAKVLTAVSPDAFVRGWR